jgi:glycosyltransferase involved in cell wall biosynthesis
MISFARIARRESVAIARKHSIEAVIVFFTLPCGPVARRLKRVLNLPYIVSLRGGDVPGLVPNLKFYHRLLCFWRRRILADAKAIVANDQGLARLSEAADPYPVHVVPNGVDCDYFVPLSSPSSPQSKRPFRWLFAGRLHVQKNLALLFSEFAALNKIGSGAGKLMIVGDGPIAKDLHTYAKELGIAGLITWLGWIQRDEVLSAYQSADAILNPSQYEGLPNVVLEAMACSRPVIASDIPGNNTLVLHEQTGLLFQLDDPHSLRKAMARFLLDPALVEKLGSAARIRVQREYSWDRVAQRYLELFQSGN